MKAIVLAAGRGSRLSRLTGDRPKCLVELAGRTLLSWQIAALNEAGIEQVVVVGGYMKGRLLGGSYQIVENPRWAETNMVSTLCCARQFLLSGPAIVAYSDIVYHPLIVTTLMQSDCDIAITYDRQWAHLWRERFEDPLEDAETFQVQNGQMVTIGQKPKHIEEIEGQYMGLLKFTPYGWAAVERLLEQMPAEDRDRVDMTALLQNLISAGQQVQAVPVDGRWCEVDRDDDLLLYEERLAQVEKGHRWPHDWRW